MEQTTEATVTLAEFLLARIAEDRDAAFVGAARAPYGPGAWYMDESDFYAMEDERLAIAGRALAECEVRRRIVEVHTSDGGHECPADSPNDPYTDFAVACPTLRILALPYADHPDFRPEWAV